MDDVISREAALKAACNGFCHPGIFCPDTGCKELDLIKNLPAAERWTPRSERLPKVGQRVLICTAEDGILLAKFGWAYDDESGNRYEEWAIVANEYCDVRLYDDDIIAWMPLPEPYKGEQDG